ncbi:hypothetical protein VTI74DRAFT_7957 [Chaetomium olivicolor]
MALEMVEYHWETFQNHQFSISTPYFGFTPSDQIENAWNGLLPKHPIAIPSSRLGDLGRAGSEDDPSWVRDPKNPDAILALPEYAVQLACLNFLRQVGYRAERDFTYLKRFSGGEDLVWERAYQCLERLRHAIMCWGDVSAIPLFYDDHGRPTQEGTDRNDVSFDFGSLEYCRNFDALNEWTQKNGVQDVLMDDFWWGGHRNTSTVP